MNILYIIGKKQGAQYRYRVKNVAKVLNKSKRWSASSVLVDEVMGVVSDRFEVIVIERQTDKYGNIKKLIRQVCDVKTKVLMDLDDLVFDYKDLGLIRKSVHEKSWLYWVGYIWGIRRIAKRVNGFICTNEFLAKKLEQSFKKPVKVIRNSLNKRQIEVSEKYLQEKDHEGFVIGYFSGSPTHIKDFGLVEPELIRFLKNHDDAKLRIVGYMKFSGLMKELIRKGRVEIVAPVDYLKLQELIAKVDVNIAPLVINDFTNCKSELKFFEAAVVETTTIASPTYTFKNAIKDGENGFLVRPGEWYDELEYLYNNPEENRRIAKNAKDYALKYYYGEEFLKEVEEAYDYFAK